MTAHTDVEQLLRVREVSCRGSLADLAHTLLAAAGVPALQRELAEARAQHRALGRDYDLRVTHNQTLDRQLAAALRDRDTLAFQLELLCDAVEHLDSRLAERRAHPDDVAAVVQAVEDARDLLNGIDAAMEAHTAAHPPAKAA